VLELDDGIFISESTAITEYLDNLDGNPILTGTTPLERAIILMMQHRTEAYVIAGRHLLPLWHARMGTELPKYKAPNGRRAASGRAAKPTKPGRECATSISF
jgi:glutathione S-transferase